MGTELHDTHTPAAPWASVPLGQKLRASIMISDGHFIICILICGVE